MGHRLGFVVRDAKARGAAAWLRLGVVLNLLLIPVYRVGGNSPPTGFWWAAVWFHGVRGRSYFGRRVDRESRQRYPRAEARGFYRASRCEAGSV